MERAGPDRTGKRLPDIRDARDGTRAGGTDPDRVGPVGPTERDGAGTSNNVCVARQLANAEGFGSEHVPEEYGNEALDWATSWMLLTVELVLASVHAEPARFKRLHEISDQWQRALEEYKGGF